MQYALIIVSKHMGKVWAFFFLRYGTFSTSPPHPIMCLLSPQTHKFTFSHSNNRMECLKCILYKSWGWPRIQPINAHTRLDLGHFIVALLFQIIKITLDMNFKMCAISKKLL